MGPGPEGQARGVASFRAYLQGRIAWVEQAHPRRGATLRRMFDAIDWR